MTRTKGSSEAAFRDLREARRMTGAQSSGRIAPFKQHCHSLSRVELLCCSACDEPAEPSTGRSSMPAISEAIMGSRLAAPDDLAPLVMMSCGRRSAWKDNERVSHSFAKRYLRGHLGVDPVRSPLPDFDNDRARSHKIVK